MIIFLNNNYIKIPALNFNTKFNQFEENYDFAYL